MSNATIETSRAGDVLLFRVKGDIDSAAIDALRHARIVYAEGSARDVVVDLGGVSFMDSSGVGWLIELDLRARERGGSVVVVEPSVRVRELLGLVGLSKRFGLATTSDLGTQRGQAR